MIGERREDGERRELGVFERRKLDRRCVAARDPEGGIETAANEQASNRQRALKDLRKDMAFIVSDDEALAHEILGFSLDCRSRTHTDTGQVWTLFASIYYGLVSRNLELDTDDGICAFQESLMEEDR